MGRCYVKLAIYLTLLPGQWRREVNGRHYKRPSDIMCLYKWGDGVVRKNATLLQIQLTPVMGIDCAGRDQCYLDMRHGHFVELTSASPTLKSMWGGFLLKVEETRMYGCENVGVGSV